MCTDVQPAPASAPSVSLSPPSGVALVGSNLGHRRDLLGAVPWPCMNHCGILIPGQDFSCDKLQTGCISAFTVSSRSICTVSGVAGFASEAGFSECSVSHGVRLDWEVFRYSHSDTLSCLVSDAGAQLALTTSRLGGRCHLVFLAWWSCCVWGRDSGAKSDWKGFQVMICYTMQKCTICVLRKCNVSEFHLNLTVSAEEGRARKGSSGDYRHQKSSFTPELQQHII